MEVGREGRREERMSVGVIVDVELRACWILAASGMLNVFSL